MMLIFLLATLLVCSFAASVPVVCWHGMDSDSSDPNQCQNIERLLRAKDKHVDFHYVHVLGDVDDELLASMLGVASEEVAEACRKLSKVAALKGGFHAIGFDQGGLFLRALQQTCPTISIKNLVTFATPHRGLDRVPVCSSSTFVCNAFNAAASLGEYSTIAQSEVLLFQYFHDKTNEQAYKDGCDFLPPLNNIVTVNAAYKARMEQLEKFVMVAWPQDTTFVPVLSQHFGFAKPLRQTEIYKKDLVGLKTLDTNKKLVLLDAAGSYPSMTDAWFYKNVCASLGVNPSNLPTPFPTGPPTPHHHTPSPTPHHTPKPTPHGHVTPKPTPHGHVTPKPTPHGHVTPKPTPHKGPVTHHTPKPTGTPFPTPHQHFTPHPTPAHLPTPFPTPKVTHTPHPTPHGGGTPHPTPHGHVTPQPTPHKGPFTHHVTPKPTPHKGPFTNPHHGTTSNGHHTLPATTESTTAATTLPPPPKDCPQDSQAWAKETKASIAKVHALCFHDLSKADVSTFSADICGALSKGQLAMLNDGCEGMQVACVKALTPAVFAGFVSSCAAGLLPAAVAQITPKQGAELTPAAIGGFTDKNAGSLPAGVIGGFSGAQFNGFTPKATSALSSGQLDMLSDKVCAEINTNHAKAFNGAACKGLKTGCIDAFPSWEGFQAGCVTNWNQTAVANAKDAQLNSFSSSGWAGLNPDEWLNLAQHHRGVLEKQSASKLDGVSQETAQKVSDMFAAHNASTTDACKEKFDFADATWLDFALFTDDSTSCITDEDLKKLDPAAFNGMRKGQVGNLPPALFKDFKEVDTMHIGADGAQGLNSNQVEELSPAAFTGLCDHLGDLSTNATEGVSAMQLEALGNSNCSAKHSCDFLHHVRDKVLDDAKSNSTGLGKLISECGVGGWTAIDKAVLITCIIVFICCLVCCVIYGVRRQRQNDRNLGKYEALINDS